MTNLFAKTAAFALMLGATSMANAAFLTSNTIGSPTVVDFSDQGTVTSNAGPIQVGGLVGEDITVVMTDASANLYTTYDGWGLGDNGEWTDSKTYISGDLNSGPGLRIAFNSGPVAAVGGFMNYYPDDGDPLVIIARDSGNNILESHDVTALADIATPGGTDAGAFRGISRPSADIAYFEIIGDYPALDDLTFTRSGSAANPGASAIPTLPFYGLVISALGLTLLARRRFSARSRIS